MPIHRHKSMQTLTRTNVQVGQQFSSYRKAKGEGKPIIHTQSYPVISFSQVGLSVNPNLILICLVIRPNLQCRFLLCLQIMNVPPSNAFDDAWSGVSVNTTSGLGIGVLEFWG